MILKDIHADIKTTAIIVCNIIVSNATVQINNIIINTSILPSYIQKLIFVSVDLYIYTLTE